MVPSREVNLARSPGCAEHEPVEGARSRKKIGVPAGTEASQVMRDCREGGRPNGFESTAVAHWI